MQLSKTAQTDKKARKSPPKRRSSQTLAAYPGLIFDSARFQLSSFLIQLKTLRIHRDSDHHLQKPCEFIGVLNWIGNERWVWFVPSSQPYLALSQPKQKICPNPALTSSDRLQTAKEDQIQPRRPPKEDQNPAALRQELQGPSQTHRVTKLS